MSLLLLYFLKDVEMNAAFFECMLILAGIFYCLFNLLSGIYSNFLRPPKNLIERYGENSWAVVTGATDGIGKAFCYSLAEKGFNIAFVSRTLEKLNKCKQEFEKAFPKNQFSVHVANFTQSHEKGFFDKLSEEFKDKDISILVNNVGLADAFKFTNFPEEALRDLLVVNTYPQVMMSSLVLPSMLKREKKSAIIDLSSVASVHPIPHYSMYSATKTFNKFISQALRAEFADKNIDVMTMTPCYVTSPMTLNTTNLLFITAKQCADASLKKLGYEAVTFGHWYHCFQGFFYALPPTWLMTLAKKVFFGMHNPALANSKKE